MQEYDKIIIGAGLYGLYAALHCCQKGQRILLLERESAPFKRASYINQARVHQGYHYPRSIATALKSAGYFERFSKEFAFCINREFEQIYATSSQYSWSDGGQFKKFCKTAQIPCKELRPETYFKEGMCDGAFLTREYTYDASILKDHIMEQLAMYRKNLEMRFGICLKSIEREHGFYVLEMQDGSSCKSGFVLNATYAGVNQILKLAGFAEFAIKYEICEVILCNVNEQLRNLGITVMDGPFFSIMPFGQTGLHSLTAVTFTPHATSYEFLPNFSCQQRSQGICSSLQLANCNECPARPETAFPYMCRLAQKYMLDDYRFTYRGSLYSLKPILASSEIDDSRPTVIRKQSSNPTFISVLSGKINTVYDIEEVLDNE